MDKIALYDVLEHRLSERDLRGMVFRLEGMRYDDLAGPAVTDKLLDLLQRLADRQQLETLLPALHRVRPDLHALLVPELAEPVPQPPLPVIPPSEPVVKKHIFLSYSRANLEEVARLHDELRQAGEAVWWDQEILPGQDWQAELRGAMQASYAVLLCLSQEAVARPTSWIYTEAQEAIDLYRLHPPGSIFLIPVRLSDCIVPDLPMHGTRTLRHLHYEDLFPDSRRARGLQRLLQALQKAPGRPQELLQSAAAPLQQTAAPFWATRSGEDAYGRYADCEIQGVVQRLRWIPSGEFLMGSPESEPARSDDETLHRVQLSQGFWLADTPCTQALWQAVMGGNPSHFVGPDRPVERVSWDEAQAFLTRLQGLAPGAPWRLPTEAEWEYACRAGTSTPFWFGAQITPAQVNYEGNYPYTGGTTGLYRQETVPVKTLPCNSWGLYQMHGNVWEWCQDWYGAYTVRAAVSAAATAATAERAAVDPVGPAGGDSRVLRGGGWISLARDARSARRDAYRPAGRHHGIGFRCARGPEPGQ